MKYTGYINGDELGDPKVQVLRGLRERNVGACVRESHALCKSIGS